MPTLTIDNRSIEVPQGTKVITAAEQLGIHIPRFCFHPALGAVGACRVCAVNFLEGPVKGIQMSCMVNAADGMQVSTTDAEAVDFRRHVIELLMLNHPHDCPVCDEGGHCLLQDMTISGGHGNRRYLGPKRTHQDQYLGPLVAHEMNRCIQCYRCVRLYREYCGYHDLGVMGIGSRVYFGRQKPGTLASPFTGNLIDICPTGVFTDRPSRHKGRRWDFERTPSICIHCSLGCNITVSARYREIVRREARHNPEVNGDFICDRGRYGYAYVNDPQRPRTGRIYGSDAEATTTLSHMDAELKKITDAHGPKAVAVIGSDRSSLETLTALKLLCDCNGYLEPVYFQDRATGIAVQQAARQYSPDLAAALPDLAASDLILVVGADPLNEAPILALILRQAHRNGATIAVVDPRPIDLPCEFHHLQTSPEVLSVRLAGLIQAGVGQNTLDQFPETAETFAALEALEIENQPLDGKLDAAMVRLIKRSKRPTVVCGTQVIPPQVADLAADAVRLLQASGKAARLLYLFPKANSLAAGRLTTTANDLEALIQGMEKGEIKALLTVENDPLLESGQRIRLEKALEKVKMLAVLDCIDGPLAQKAHLYLPIAAVDEAGGTFINTQGRAQAASKAFTPGIPIAHTGQGDHPPRVFDPLVPGGELYSAAKILLQLAGEDPTDIKRLSAALPDDLKPIFQMQNLPETGLKLAFSAPAPTESALAPAETSESTPQEEADSLKLILVEWFLGTERLSNQSPVLAELSEDPVLALHPVDAYSLGLEEAQTVIITTESGELSVPVRITPNMTPGVMVLPRHYKIDWQKLGGLRLNLQPTQLKVIAKE